MAACGGCGGADCHLLGGGLGEFNCCQGNIEDEGHLCSVSLAAPCVVDSEYDCGIYLNCCPIHMVAEDIIVVQFGIVVPAGIQSSTHAWYYSRW